MLHSRIFPILSEIRLKYWIAHGRATVRSRVKICQACKQADGKPYKLPNLAPVPEYSTLFSKVDVVYMGPLYIKQNKGS